MITTLVVNFFGLEREFVPHFTELLPGRAASWSNLAVTVAEGKEPKTTVIATFSDTAFMNLPMLWLARKGLNFEVNHRDDQD